MSLSQYAKTIGVKCYIYPGYMRLSTNQFVWGSGDLMRFILDS